MDMPFDIPDIRLENGEAQAHVRLGWAHSVVNIYRAFSSSSLANRCGDGQTHSRVAGVKA